MSLRIKLIQKRKGKQCPKSGYRKVVQVRFLFRALGFQPIRKVEMLRPFFICKQLANKLLAEVRKNIVYLKVIQIIILIKSHHTIGDFVLTP